VHSDAETITVKEAVAALPAASVAVQETVCVPTAKVEPLVGVQVIPMLAEGVMLSVAVGAKVTTAPAADVAGTVPPATVSALKTGAVMSSAEAQRCYVLRPASAQITTRARGSMCRKVISDGSSV
jgi:hypothetical protein